MKSGAPPITGPVDPAALQRVLDGRWHEWRDRVRELAADPVFRTPVGLSEADYRELVFKQAQALADHGMTGLAYPAAYGGADDPGASVTVFEMLAYGDPSLLVKTGVQWGLFGGAVHHLGTANHHEKYLRRIASLELPGCFAMTETAHGSDVAALQTTATYDADAQQFVVHTPTPSASKDYIGNAAAHGRLAVVFAQLHTGGENRGVHAFLVPIRDDDGRPVPGVDIEDVGLKAGLNGVDNGRLSFDHVRIPRENLLNRYADVEADGRYRTSIASPSARFFTMLGTLVQGRISVAGGAAAAGTLGLVLAARYAQRRTQFTAPGRGEITVMDYQAHQRKLLPVLARSYAFRFAQLDLVENLSTVFTDPGTDDMARRALQTRAAGIKALGTWHASDAIQLAREACGGAGYLAVNRLAGLRADTDVFTTFEGDNTVLLQLVARDLLSRYRRRFSPADPLRLARFAVREAVNGMVDRTAVRSALARRHDLDRRVDQRRLFAVRAERRLAAVAHRLRRVRPDDPDAFERTNACQRMLMDAARAHVELELLDSFVAAVQRCADPAAAVLLGRACDLFALVGIEQDLGWFLGHRWLTPRQATEVSTSVDQLVAELRPQLDVLIEAFAIPDTALDVPMLQR